MSPLKIGRAREEKPLSAAMGGPRRRDDRAYGRVVAGASPGDSRLRPAAPAPGQWTALAAFEGGVDILLCTTGPPLVCGEVPGRCERQLIDLVPFSPYDASMSMKIVTRRGVGQDVVRDIAILQRTLNRLRGSALIPRGVYRFVSNEEADQWMTRTIAATHERRKSRT